MNELAYIKHKERCKNYYYKNRETQLTKSKEKYYIDKEALQKRLNSVEALREWRRNNMIKRRYQDHRKSNKTMLKRGLESFLISYDEYYNYATNTCSYCGIEGEEHAPNGVDRVDSSKGYLPDNCVSCCWTCNKMKSEYSVDTFKNHIIKIYNKICV